MDGPTSDPQSLRHFPNAGPCNVHLPGFVRIEYGTATAQ
jgi:hypothetical protein